ncbi:MAG: O-antigen ligase family protein [Bacteroidota bacterium]
MLATLRQQFATLPTGATPVLIFVAIVLLSVFSAAASGYYIIAAVPVALLVLFLSIVNFKPLFWLLIICIPISTEVELPGGFGTDLPTEPIMVGLMALFGLFVLRNLKSLSFDLVRHPLTLILIAHLAWLMATTITSDLIFVSVKFLLAKLWYVVTFFGLSAYLLRSDRDFRQFFWIFFWPFIFMVFVIMLRHALLGFSFQGIHSIMHPFQRNHVNYAAALALFYPFMVMMLERYKRWSLTWWVLVGALVFVLGAIYFSYTRAAYISLVIALGTYYIIRWRLMRYALIVSGIALIAGVVHMVKGNTYLEYAPNYDRTISHERFDNLIEATYKMEDISTMERVYRWVAAGHMAPERPFFGWGPGNFVNFYKPFAVTSFQTYVSDNPEQSGIHSYFFMTLVEQGVPGLLIFLTLLVVFFSRGEYLYHALEAYPLRQNIVMTVLLSTTVITAFLLINDLIETDKIGSFFFINLALLINQDLFLLRQHRETEA